MPHYLPIGPLPEEKKQAVIAIALDAYSQLKENDKQFASAGREFIRQNEEKYGIKAYVMPLPPEIQALGERPVKIIGENAERLRQALGEEYFKAFDEELSRSNSMRENAARYDTVKPSSPTGAAAPRQLEDSPAPVQMPRVQQ